LTDKGQDGQEKKDQNYGEKAFVIEIDDINDFEIIQDFINDPLSTNHD
jgi:hypothetical protein